MAKKIVKRKRVKIIPLLLMLIVIALVVFGIDLYLNTQIKNITILNTNHLSDEYIMRISKLEDYPSYYYTTNRSIKNKLLKSPYIKDAKVKKGFYHTLTITIYENRPLLYDTTKKKYVLENGKTVGDEFDFKVPLLTNQVEKKKYKKLLTKLKTIKEDVLVKTSEISYVPNNFDKDRFLLYMDDDNMVYLTLSKFKKLNYYNDVLEQLEGKKGILYLDSGNHFKIMK